MSAVQASSGNVTFVWPANGFVQSAAPVRGDAGRFATRKEILGRRPRFGFADVVVRRVLRLARLEDEVPLVLRREEEDLGRRVIAAQTRRVVVEVVQGRRVRLRPV